MKWTDSSWPQAFPSGGPDRLGAMMPPWGRLGKGMSWLDSRHQSRSPLQVVPWSPFPEPGWCFPSLHHFWENPQSLATSHTQSLSTRRWLQLHAHNLCHKLRFFSSFIQGEARFHHKRSSAGRVPQSARRSASESPRHLCGHVPSEGGVVASFSSASCPQRAP